MVMDDRFHDDSVKSNTRIFLKNRKQLAQLSAPAATKLWRMTLFCALQLCLIFRNSIDKLSEEGNRGNWIQNITGLSAAPANHTDWCQYPAPLSFSYPLSHFRFLSSLFSPFETAVYIFHKLGFEPMTALQGSYCATIELYTIPRPFEHREREREKQYF